MAITLHTGDRIGESSSKGNQEKWLEEGRWYKVDLFGYEGLVETVASQLLALTNLEVLGISWVSYRMERLEVHRHQRNGCSSPNFLQEDQSLLTLAELFRKGIGPGWKAQISHTPNLKSRVQWLVEQTEQITGLTQFGQYLTTLWEADMLFGNEDRHLNNIAVLRGKEGFAYCPFFDFGAGLLSNTRDYPMDIAPKAQVGQLQAQPLRTTFARQVHAAQELYGPQLQWAFKQEDMEAPVEEPLSYYAQRDIPLVRDRVKTCLNLQQKKLKAK